jgi:hypothetical protein
LYASNVANQADKISRFVKGDAIETAFKEQFIAKYIFCSAVFVKGIKGIYLGHIYLFIYLFIWENAFTTAAPTYKVVHPKNKENK